LSCCPWSPLWIDRIFIEHTLQIPSIMWICYMLFLEKANLQFPDLVVDLVKSPTCWNIFATPQLLAQSTFTDTHGHAQSHVELSPSTSQHLLPKATSPFLLQLSHSKHCPFVGCSVPCVPCAFVGVFSVYMVCKHVLKCCLASLRRSR
jgi:hypothetical protein